MDTGSIIDPENAIPFHADELSIDDYATLTGKSKKSDKDLENTDQKKKLKYYSSNHANAYLNSKQSGKNEILHSQVSSGGGAMSSSKHARKAIENRRNSALSPKTASETIKGLQSVALIQKASLE